MRTNYLNKKVEFIILYAGPDHSGKATNLKYLSRQLDSAKKGKLIEIGTSPAKTYRFDLATNEFFNKYSIDISLRTYPNSEKYRATQKLAAKGVDGIVFIVDSQISRFDENIETFLNLSDSLFPTGEYHIPLVCQLNKRDLPNVFSAAEFFGEIDRLNEITGKRKNPPASVVEAQASRAEGVLETYRNILDAVLINAAIKERK